MRPYEKDLIAERDARSKLASTLIKWWRVNYIDSRGASKLDEQPMGLPRENDTDTAATGSEDYAMNISVETEPVVSESDYNAATGSYSGAYGKNVTLDEEGLSQVASILGERKNAFEDMLSAAK